MATETRLKNLAISYNIVKEYNSKSKTPISYRSLMNLINQLTGVTELTAKEYISALVNGVRISGKLYKIREKEGGLENE
jgi:hypothetical protein